MWLLALVLLHPILDEPGDVRLVARGVGDEGVAWTIDGELVASTSDREAIVVWMDAGQHEVTAQSAGGGWMAMVRPTAAGHGAAVVPAWTATAPEEPEPLPPPAPPQRTGPMVPMLAGMAGVGLLFSLIRKPKWV